MVNNSNLDILMEKIFDNEAKIDQIMVTDDMVELYKICQTIQDGYTFEEFCEFFDQLVCMCLDEIGQAAEEAQKISDDEIKKLSEKALNEVSGGANVMQRIAASALASLSFMTSAHIYAKDTSESNVNPNFSQLRDEKSFSEKYDDLRSQEDEEPPENISTGAKILNTLNKLADTIWDNKGKILLASAALITGGAALVGQRDKIGGNFQAAIKNRDELEETKKALNELRNDKMPPEAKFNAQHYLLSEKERLEKEGFVKKLTEGLVLTGALTTTAGGVATLLSKTTGAFSSVRKFFDDVNMIRYQTKELGQYKQEAEKLIELNMQKEAEKKYDSEKEERVLRKKFDNEIHGQKGAKEQIMSFFVGFSAERKAAKMGAYVSDLPEPKVLIFNGPSGTGKTYMANLLSESLTSIKPYVLTAGDVLQAAKNSYGDMPYALLYSNTKQGADRTSTSSLLGESNTLASYLKSTEGHVRVVILDEFDKIYKKGNDGKYPSEHPLDEVLRSIYYNELKDHYGNTIDLNGLVFICTTNETSASLQGRVKVTSQGKLMEIKGDDTGKPVIDDGGDFVYITPKYDDDSGTQTLVPHDSSIAQRFANSTCYFDKLTVDDYEKIARSAIEDIRSIPNVAEYNKHSSPYNVSLIIRISEGIGGVLITDADYRKIAQYAAKMPNAARAIVGAGGSKTGSVCGNLYSSVVEEFSAIKNAGKSYKGLTFLAKPYETHDSTGKLTIKFKIFPLGYDSYDNYSKAAKELQSLNPEASLTADQINDYIERNSETDK